MEIPVSVILKGLGDIFTCDINIKNPPDNK